MSIKMSAEKSICQALASVMLYDDSLKTWVASGGSGMSRVHIYQHTVNNSFRVVGRLATDQSVVINCSILKGLKYNQATPTFHQWRDSRQVYGLNFQSNKDAEAFASAMLASLELLSQAPAPSRVPPPPSQTHQNNEEESRQRALEQQRQQEQQRLQEQQQQEQQQLEQQRIEQQRIELQQRQEQQKQQELKELRLEQQRQEQQRLEQQRHSAEIAAAASVGPPPPPVAPPVPPVPPVPSVPSVPQAKTSPTQPGGAPSGAPPPPPPPPPPNAGGGAPPPPPATGGGLAAALASAKLNKVKKDDSSTSSSSGSTQSKVASGGPGGGGLMNEMQLMLQKRLKKSDSGGGGDSKQSPSLSSGRTSPPNTGHTKTGSDTTRRPWEKDTKASGPPTANRFDRFGAKTNGTTNDASGSPKLGRRGSNHTNGTTISDGDFEKLKQEISADIRIQLNQFKLEIIEAVKIELSKR